MDFLRTQGSKPFEVDSSPSPTVLGALDDEVEEIVRRVTHPPSALQDSRPRSYRGPVRRRIRIEKGGKTYQMFEISTTDSRRSMDGSEASSSSVVTIVTPATSSCTDPWSSSGGWVEEAEEDADIDWDHEDEQSREDDDGLLVPKLEPIDDVDMADLSDLKDSVVPETPSGSSAPVRIKKPRGRPRKHPKPSPKSLAKGANGRSKTGCITCRRRKKKCDETKPGCLNCEKNSVKCEGYPEKTTWKSGREKAEEARRRSFTMSNVKLPYLVHGVETEGDRMFLQHYVSRLSMIFTLEGEDTAFRNILLPMAQQHSGLMHSILALSSKHIDYKSPYGLHILQEHPGLDVKTLEERSQFHHDEAFRALTSRKHDEVEVPPATYAQMICFVLQTLSEENPNGSHRVHLQYYQKLIQQSPPAEDEFSKFIHEFFQYHIRLDQLIYLPQSGVHFVSITDDWNLPATVYQPSAVRLLGVFDGLFLYMSKITNLRNKIRFNMENGIDPIVGYQSLLEAAEIDAGIREWTPAWPAGDPRDVAGMLYRQMMWIYLWRTIYPPQIMAGNTEVKKKIKKVVDDGLALLPCFGPRDPSQTLILAPAFVIGCAAFEEEQREPIRKAIGIVKNYMEYRNTDTALEVLEEVWRLMDRHDNESWDWQSIAKRMGMDFLAT